MSENKLLTESLTELKSLKIDKKHEDFVSEFISTKFQSIGYVICKDKISYWNAKANKNNSHAPGFVVFQPNGTQQSPDIQIIKCGNVLVNIELKSSKQNRPMWNGGRVQLKTIYIFSKGDDTTFFLAEHTNLIPFYNIVDKFLVTINPLIEAMNKESKLAGYLHSFYLRHMYNDGNNYFDKNRKEREQKVMSFISSL